ncbi:unnamed protein product, partial [Hapterophycus canaliculatus]
AGWRTEQLFLVLWQRRSHTLAFRWGVHKEDKIDRAKFMVGWKRPGRAGMTPEGIRQRQSSFSSTSTSTSTSTTATAPLSSNGSSTHGNKPPPAPCKMLAAAGRRRQCAKGGFRATAAAVAAAAAAGATDRAPSSRQNWAVFGRGGGVGAGGIREDGLEGGAWEPLRTARMFLSWSLEAVLLYLAIRMMLW